jgi:hypothetical protein
LTLKCRKHPKYKAKLEPKGSCPACEDLHHLAEEVRADQSTVFWSFVIEEG